MLSSSMTYPIPESRVSASKRIFSILKRFVFFPVNLHRVFVRNATVSTRRQTAVQRLVKDASKSSINSIFQVIDDPDAPVRAEAISGLLEIGTDEIIERLLKTIPSADPATQYSIIYIITNILQVPDEKYSDAVHSLCNQNYTLANEIFSKFVFSENIPAEMLVISSMCNDLKILLHSCHNDQYKGDKI
jgi:hypothetical protein